MKILFLSHYFPPEVNAPANRTFEHCREWARLGHEVHVVTGFPSHPAGRVFPGYRRRWYRREEMEGIHVHRIWTHLAANRGVVRRTLNYLSFVPTSVWRALRLGRFDVILATSPQFFNAVAGWLAGSLKRTPWVFELRDLWPDSVVAVGALKRSWLLRVIERLELHLYRDAALVVSVTESFIENLVGRGISREKIHYVPNGIFPENWVLESLSQQWREENGISADQVVVAYVGTIGMAHSIETLLEAASFTQESHPDLLYLIVGDGAERERLEALAKAGGLHNVIFTGLLPRDEIQRIASSTDISVVLLRDSPLFRTVLPSKMFEAMACGNPIVLGVKGEARAVLERSGAGVPVEPEDGGQLAEAIIHLAKNPQERETMAQKGRAFASRNFNRHQWACRYLDLLETLFIT